MAEPHVLSNARLSHEALNRMVDDLRIACERGTDLGSRRPQIRMAGADITKLSGDLDHELYRLQRILEKLDIDDPSSVAPLRSLVAALNKLGRLVENFPSAESDVS